MRVYSKVDLLRFNKFAKENEDLVPIKLLKAYDIKYPELSSTEKLINLAKGLKLNKLYKALTGKNLSDKIDEDDMEKFLLEGKYKRSKE